MEEKIVEKLELPPLSEAPWLVYTHGNKKRKKIQTFCQFSPHIQSYVKSIPALRGKEIFGSCHGWLVLLDREDLKTFSLWNMMDKVISLPPMVDPLKNFNSCCFTSSSVEEADILVFCGKFVYSCGVTKNRIWVSQRIELVSKQGRLVRVNPTVTCNGVIYGFATVENVSDNGEPYTLRYLVAVEFSTKNSVPIKLRNLHLKLPDTEDFYYIRSTEYLVESCGAVYLVKVLMRHVESEHRINAVKIWKLDLHNMNWVEVHSLDDRCLFLDNNNCSTWCWATTTSGIEGNCVYFRTNDDKVLYLYRLQDRSFTPLCPCPNLVSPCHYLASWVMPHHQRLVVPGKERKLNSVDQGEEVDDLPAESDMTLMSLLPSDVTALISSKYLHLFDYVNLLKACGKWKSTMESESTLPPPERRSKNNNGDQYNTNSMMPLLLFSKNDNGLCKVLDPSRSNESCSIVLPMLSNSETFIDYSKDGWLLLGLGGRNSDWLSYLNPLTNERGVLPLPEDNWWLHIIYTVGFSTCPTSFDCVTVVVSEIPTSLFFHYCLSGRPGETWKTVEFDNTEEVNRFLPGRSSPVYLDGAFYFLDRTSGKLGEFKLVPSAEGGGQQKASWKVYCEPDANVGTDELYQSYNLVECDGELLSVFIGDMGGWLQVFKFNRSTKRWVEIESLGNHILFLSPSSSISAVVSNEQEYMRNRIYLPRLHGNKKDIVYYSLDTEKYQAGNEVASVNFYGTTELVRSCWI